VCIYIYIHTYKQTYIHTYVWGAVFFYYFLCKVTENKKINFKALQGKTLVKPLSRCKKIICVNFPSLYMRKIMGGLIRMQYICIIHTYIHISRHKHTHTHTIHLADRGHWPRVRRTSETRAEMQRSDHNHLPQYTAYAEAHGTARR
jgi:hypothetical protein